MQDEIGRNRPHEQGRCYSAVHNKERYELQTLYVGCCCEFCDGPDGHGERGVDGDVNIIYWQAPSILNPFLSGGTKDVESASLVIEPLARYN